jgi:prepilin-type N-terminal cleavage/methylation domain-containing protein
MAAADRRRRKGGTLLEVVVALVILAIAGVGLLTLVGETAHDLDVMWKRETLARHASVQLERLSLSSRLELIDMVGARRSGPVDVHVRQLSASLFDLAVTDTTNAAVILRTTFYRPEAPRDSTS